MFLAAVLSEMRNLRAQSELVAELGVEPVWVGASGQVPGTTDYDSTVASATGLAGLGGMNGALHLPATNELLWRASGSNTTHRFNFVSKNGVVDDASRAFEGLNTDNAGNVWACSNQSGAEGLYRRTFPSAWVRSLTTSGTNNRILRTTDGSLMFADTANNYYLLAGGAYTGASAPSFSATMTALASKWDNPIGRINLLSEACYGSITASGSVSLGAPAASFGAGGARGVYAADSGVLAGDLSAAIAAVHNVGKVAGSAVWRQIAIDADLCAIVAAVELGADGFATDAQAHMVYHVWLMRRSTAKLQYISNFTAPAFYTSTYQTGTPYVAQRVLWLAGSYVAGELRLYGVGPVAVPGTNTSFTLASAQSGLIGLRMSLNPSRIEV